MALPKPSISPVDRRSQRHPPSSRPGCVQFTPRPVTSSPAGSLSAGKDGVPSLQRSPAVNTHPRPVKAPHTVDAERALSSPVRAQPAPPRPLFSPTILIIGDSITRNVRFFNSVTHCFPGATVPVIQQKLQGLLPSLPSSIKRVIIHVGTNDTALQQSLTKSDFNHLFNFLKHCGKSVFISGPIPTVGRGAGRFSRFLSLHAWLQSACTMWVLLTILICFGTVCLFLTETEFTQTNWALEC